jgi:uncharacterized membrane protein
VKDLEVRLGRILSVGTWVGVAALVVGVLLMMSSGLSPLEPATPMLEPGAILPGIVGLEPAAWLWVGLIVVIATPILRVIAALLGFLARGEREMGVVAISILIVVAIGVLIGRGGA